MAITTRASTQIPGPRPLPILGWRGNLLQFSRQPIGYLTSLRERWGDVVSLVRGGNHNILSPKSSDCPGTVVAFGPRSNEQVFMHTQDFHLSPLLGPVYPVGQAHGKERVLKRLGTGLVALNGEEHRRQRRVLQPAFHKKQVETYHADVVTMTDRFLRGWRIGETRDIARDMSRLARHIACRTILGCGDFFAEEAEGFDQLVLEWMSFFTSPAVMLPFLDLPGTPYRRCLESSWKLDATVRQIVARKRAAQMGTDALSLLLAEEEKGLSEDELVGHVTLLFLAGQLTSSTALTWTLFLLSQHPSIMADLLDELESTLQGEAPGIEQVKDLPLLDRVLKESMRILPAIPMTGRVVAQALELGSYCIPQGTEVIVSFYHTHHQADLYPQPEQFLPGRWEQLHPTPAEFLPYGAGQRMCIGKTFADFSMKIILAMVLQRFHLEMGLSARIDHCITGRLTLVPRPGMPMRILPPDRPYQRERCPVGGTIHELVTLG